MKKLKSKMNNAVTKKPIQFENLKFFSKWKKK